MVAHAVVTCLYAIPHLVALPVDYTDVYYRLVRAEEALHQKSLGLWIQLNIEYALVPSFGWPPLTLSKIVNGSPVSESHHLVEFHLKPVLSHRGHRCLALIECHPREASTIARKIHVTVVICLYVGDTCKVTR